MTDFAVGMFTKGGSTITARPGVAEGVRIDEAP